MVDPAYPLFPVFAFLGFLLVLIPLPWHLEAWSSAVCLYILWAASSSLNGFINAVVWASDSIDRAPIWCDISTRVAIAASVGLPAASMCITRRLYNIARTQTVICAKSEKRTALLIDTLICICVPVAVVALSYAVQDHRYDILEGLGCVPALRRTPLTSFLINSWTFVFGSLAFMYCALIIVTCHKQRAQITEFFSLRASDISLSRYLRLMALSMTTTSLLVVVASYNSYLNATNETLRSSAEQISAAAWRSDSLFVAVNELNRWQSPASAILLFLFCGLAREARQNYFWAAWFVLGKFGLRPKPKVAKGGLQPFGVLPVFVCDLTGTPSQFKIACHPEPLPPYDYPRPLRLNPSEHTSASSTSSTSGPDKPPSPFPYPTHHARAYSLPAVSSTFTHPTPIYDRFARSPPAHPQYAAPVPPLPPLPPLSPLSHLPSLRTPTSPTSFTTPVSPVSLIGSTSPTDSMFSRDSAQSAVSLSYTDIEAAYGSRMPSFVSLEIEVERSSEPPTPLNMHYVAS